jgi:hypothetical protein
MTKKQVIPVKVDPSLKADFEWACALADTNSSRELRKHMRAFSKREQVKAFDSIKLTGKSPDPVTGYHYDRNTPEDVMAVKRLTWLMRQFESQSSLNHIMPYERREADKEDGYRTATNQSLSLDERARGYISIVRAHFYRSVMDTLDVNDPKSYQKHPGFDKYMAHYIVANPFFQGNPELPMFWMAAYPLEGNLSMTAGSTHWCK